MRKYDKMRMLAIASLTVFVFLLGFSFSVQAYRISRQELNSPVSRYLRENYGVDSIEEYRAKLEQEAWLNISRQMKALASKYPELNFSQWRSPDVYRQYGTSTYQPPKMTPQQPFYVAVFSEPVTALQIFSLSGLGLIGLAAVPPIRKSKRLKQALILGVVILCVFSVGYFVGLTAAQTGTITIEPGSFTETASYVIWTDGTYVYAKNGITGAVDFKGTDASTVIQSAVKALTSGGKIFIKSGTYWLNTIADYPFVLHFKAPMTVECEKGAVFVLNVSNVPNGRSLYPFICIETGGFKWIGGEFQNKVADWNYYRLMGVYGGDSTKTFEDILFEGIRFSIKALGVTPTNCISILAIEGGDNPYYNHPVFANVKNVVVKGCYFDFGRGVELAGKTISNVKILENFFDFYDVLNVSPILVSPYNTSLPKATSPESVSSSIVSELNTILIKGNIFRNTPYRSSTSVLNPSIYFSSANGYGSSLIDIVDNFFYNDHVATGSVDAHYWIGAYSVNFISIRGNMFAGVGGVKGTGCIAPASSNVIQVKDNIAVYTRALVDWDRNGYGEISGNLCMWLNQDFGGIYSKQYGLKVHHNILYNLDPTTINKDYNFVISAGNVELTDNLVIDDRTPNKAPKGIAVTSGIAYPGNYIILERNRIFTSIPIYLAQSYPQLVIRDNFGFDTANFKSTGVSVPVGTGGTYGSARAITTLSGRITYPRVKITWGGTFGSGETVTVKVEAVYTDGSTAYVEKSATATGSLWLTDDDVLALITQGKDIVNLNVYAKTNLSSTTVTVTVDAYGKA